jgi:hypothetical protein
VRSGRVLFVAVTLAAGWALLIALLRGAFHIPEVSETRARAAALERVEGAVLREHYGREGARWTYTFDIRPRDDEGRVVFVAVDADRGTVLGVRVGHEIAHSGE